MASTLLLSAKRRLSSVVVSMATTCALTLSALPAKGDDTALNQAPIIDKEAHPIVSETCAAMFVLMAYAYADDDVKERQLEEKKVLAMADVPPNDDATFGKPQSVDERIQRNIDILTDMLLEKPVEARAIAKECFRQYPPEIELN